LAAYVIILVSFGYNQMEEVLYFSCFVCIVFFLSALLDLFGFFLSKFLQYIAVLIIVSNDGSTLV